jgi:hypothetical protein
LVRTGKKLEEEPDNVVLPGMDKKRVIRNKDGSFNKPPKPPKSGGKNKKKGGT